MRGRIRNLAHDRSRGHEPSHWWRAVTFGNPGIGPVKGRSPVRKERMAKA